MRILSAFLIIFIPLQGWAFSIPKTETKGTLSASAFCASNVHVLEEVVHVTFRKDDLTAYFSIEYKILCDSGGIQVPMALFASNGDPSHSFPGDLRVWLNNEEMVLKTGRALGKSDQGGPFDRFDDFLQANDSLSSGFESNVFRTPMPLHPERGFESFVRLKDLIFFETSLAAGKHTVKVEYSAEPWKSLNGYIAELEYVYSFVPALSWDSGVNRKIILDREALNWQLSTNLGDPHSGNSLSVANWNFQAVPGSVFSINVAPRVSWLAGSLIRLGPFGLFLILAVVFACIHLIAMRKSRLNGESKLISNILIKGSILAPVLASLIGVLGEILILSTIPDDIQGIGTLGNGVILLIFFPIVGIPAWFLLMLLPDTSMRLWFKNKSRAISNPLK